MDAYGRKTPEETVSSITRIEMDKTSLILDVAAGTGIVGEMVRVHLQEVSYVGMHG